jgi:uncharacterized protein YjbI with pentapeptide repeats
VEHKPKPGWKSWKPPPENRDRWGLRGKTVWDWLSLLVVPVMVVVVAGLFTTMQIFIQLAQEAAREQAIADQTAEFQQVIEEFRAQEASLQDYRDLMVTLLLKHHLRESAEGSEVHAIARAQTVAVLTQFDGEHNEAVTRFLSDSGLLKKPALLANTDLEGAQLPNAVLQNANLAGTNLTGANLAEADLISADFSNTEKVGEDVNLILANLNRAYLREAALQEADLAECTLGKVTLTKATLQGADLRSASLQAANLNYAALQDANLSSAVLQNANLTNAVLTDANLTNAYLSDADLTDARGWTKEQLTAARSLKGATMPNGQKYEDWLKDREKRQQDE